MPWSRAAKLFGCSVWLLGVWAVYHGLNSLNCDRPWLSLVYLLSAIVTSGFKVVLPALTGNISVSFLFILLSVLDCGLGQGIVVALASTLVQAIWHAKQRPGFVQMAFNLANVAIAVSVMDAILRICHVHLPEPYLPVSAMLAASAFYGANTLAVSLAIGLTEDKPALTVWRKGFFWSYPHYLVQGSVAAVLSVAGRLLGWQVSLLILPVLYLIYRSFRSNIDRLENDKRHAEDMASLYWRTIQGLAMAVDAKDDTTHDHLERVQVYAVEMGRELGLRGDDMEALRAASILHDIGKIGVPEHIISKPGRLTPEEFEKMKIHPVVGAEIVERIGFPYEVAPIVRGHHERWDGSGYPDGLKGEQIPIGARILAAVDCLDALATDRHYRRALPLDSAVQKVVDESGRSFDPKVVEVLARRYREWEVMAKAACARMVRVERQPDTAPSARPATGYEVALSAAGTLTPEEARREHLRLLAEAHKLAEQTLEMVRDPVNHLALADVCAVLGLRLRPLIPHAAFAVYHRRDNHLVTAYAGGEGAALFSTLEIPLGQGLSGWVAENRMPIVNGNPSVESGYLNDPSKITTLRSALGIPLEFANAVNGVVAVYRNEKDAFTRDELRLLLAIGPKLGQALQEASEASEAVAYGSRQVLPDTARLLLHLECAVEECRQRHLELALVTFECRGLSEMARQFGQDNASLAFEAMGASLRQACRETDYVAEGAVGYAAVLTGMRPDAAEVAARRLAGSAEEAARRVAGGAKVKVRIGLAHYPADGTAAEELLAEAARRAQSSDASPELKAGGILALTERLRSEEMSQTS